MLLTTRRACTQNISNIFVLQRPILFSSGLFCRDGVVTRHKCRTVVSLAEAKPNCQRQHSRLCRTFRGNRSLPHPTPYPSPSLPLSPHSFLSLFLPPALPFFAFSLPFSLSLSLSLSLFHPLSLSLSLSLSL